jgi:integrase
MNDPSGTSDPDIIDTLDFLQGESSLEQRRKLEETSAVYQSLIGLRGRQAGRAASTGRPRRGSDYTYRRAWVDFALFLRYRRGDGLLEDWLNDESAYRSAETNRQLTYLDQHVADITTGDIKEYKQALLNKTIIDRRGVKHVGLQASTINTRLAAVSKVLDTAVDMKLRTDNPAKRVSRLNTSRTYKQDPMSDEQVLGVLESIDRSTLIGERDYTLMLTLALLGIRREEASRMTFNDFDSGDEEEELVLRILGKGDKVRFLTVTKQLQKQLQRYAARLQLSSVVFPVVRAKGTVEKELPLHPDDITRIVSRRTKQLFGKSKPPHAWRSTFATKAKEQDVPDGDLQYVMGHKDKKTTDLYTRDRTHRRRRATRAVSYERSNPEDS